MKSYIDILTKTKLFYGINKNDIDSMLTCLDANLRHYKKGEYIFRQGNHITNITILINGLLHIQNDDYWGNRIIINHIEKGEIFGESFIAPQAGPITHDVIAIEDSTVIFLEVEKIINSCKASCRFHSMIIQNLLFITSEKNKRLVQKINHISKHTIRERLMAYLSEEAIRNNNSSFEIPFNRQQLANYLSVDRSALSNELCKMRNEGLLIFKKNKFTLL